MKFTLYILLVLLSWTSFGQERDSIPYEDTTHVEYYVVMGDTIARETIGLDEVLILGKIRFKSDTDRRRYLILRRKTRKVYPYAKLASERLLALNGRLDDIKSKRDRKKYTKIVQNYIEDQFSAELKKLTHTEGQILVKLIYRQTGVTAFDLIKNLKSGWRAFWYNTTASLFDISLKEEYHPESNKEDYLIEDILQRSFQSKVLEPQAPAMDLNFSELTSIWNARNVK